MWGSSLRDLYTQDAVRPNIGFCIVANLLKINVLITIRHFKINSKAKTNLDNFWKQNMNIVSF